MAKVLRVASVVVLAAVLGGLLAAPVSAQGSGLSVSGYAFTTPAAAQSAASARNYRGGHWVTQVSVLSYHGSVVYTTAGWVVPCKWHHTNTLNTAAYSYSGWDVFWFQGLGQNEKPFWW